MSNPIEQLENFAAWQLERGLYGAYVTSTSLKSVETSISNTTTPADTPQQLGFPDVLIIVADNSLGNDACKTMLHKIIEAMKINQSYVIAESNALNDYNDFTGKVICFGEVSEEAWSKRAQLKVSSLSAMLANPTLKIETWKKLQTFH